MSADPDRILSRIVVTALTIVVVALLLLIAVLLREFWLQQRVAELSGSVQVNLEDLEKTTDAIQSELSDVRAAPDPAQEGEAWSDVARLLDDVDQQLETIEENLAEVVTVLEPEADLAAADQPSPQEPAVTQDRADQVFTIFTLLLGVASIAIAILLGMALSVEQGVTGEGRGLKTFQSHRPE
ncbi:hypothetical protein RY27_30475 [Litorilinea aerophila]|nr:hypothetical protein RY27_30475 [Litorilinea aerophila]